RMCRPMLEGPVPGNGRKAGGWRGGVRPRSGSDPKPRGEIVGRPRTSKLSAMDVPAWAVWVVIAVFMLAIEATTTAFFTIYFGVAAAIVAALSLAGFGVPIQIVAFGALSVGGMVLTRPQLKRIAGMGSATVPSGVDAMPGKIGIVTKQIGELETGL